MRPYVEAYWEMERNDLEPVDTPISAVAVLHMISSRGDLPLHIVDGKFAQVPKYVFAGLVDKMGQTLRFHGRCEHFGITFTPLGLWHLLGVPPALCSNEAVAFERVCNYPLPDLLIDPPGEAGLEKRFNIAGAWCLSLIDQVDSKLDEVKQLMHNIRESLGQAPVLSLIEQKTPRQVQRKFRKIMGMTAKHYARLLRFNAALMLLSSEPDIPLLDAAVRTGYYDVPHLCHDFRELKAPLPGHWAKDPQEHTTALLDPLLRK